MLSRRIRFYSNYDNAGFFSLLDSELEIFPYPRDKREGYIFLGWATTPDEKDPLKYYYPGDPFTIDQGIGDFFAIWEQNFALLVPSQDIINIANAIRKQKDFYVELFNFPQGFIAEIQNHIHTVNVEDQFNYNGFFDFGIEAQNIHEVSIQGTITNEQLGFQNIPIIFHFLDAQGKANAIATFSWQDRPYILITRDFIISTLAENYRIVSQNQDTLSVQMYHISPSSIDEESLINNVVFHPKRLISCSMNFNNNNE